MGLTAVVYNTKDKIKNMYQLDTSLLLNDKLTGEVYLKDDHSASDIVEFNTILCEKHIGNIAYVHFLYNKLKTILTDESIIISKILYNGSHSGDIIPAAEMEKLNEEIQCIKKHIDEKYDDEFTRFIITISELQEASITTNNPIVFV